MADEDDFDASPELQELIVLSIGMGLDNLQKEHSLVPMLVSVENDQYAIGALAVDADRLWLLRLTTWRHFQSLPVVTHWFSPEGLVLVTISRTL